jgi:phosphotransferase system  glucose/maltose/N-acetylglucosamine-specific IIC component
VSASVVDDAPCPEQGRPVIRFVPIVLSLLVLLLLVLLLPLVVPPGAVVLGTIAGFVGDTGFSGEPGTVTGALGFTVGGGG